MPMFRMSKVKRVVRLLKFWLSPNNLIWFLIGVHCASRTRHPRHALRRGAWGVRRGDRSAVGRLGTVYILNQWQTAPRGAFPAPRGAARAVCGGPKFFRST